MSSAYRVALRGYERAVLVRTVLSVVLTALVAVGAAACGSVPGVTGDEGATAEPDPPPTGAEDPESAARGLVRAWQDGDRGTAAGYAEDEALAALFGAPEPLERLELVHCLPGDVPTEAECLFEGSPVSLSLQLRRTPEDDWAAVSARFLP